MDKFCENFKSVIQFFYNLSYEEFKPMFIETLGLNPAYTSNKYIMDYFSLVRSNFIEFYNRMDSESMSKFIRKAFEKYGCQ